MEKNTARDEIEAVLQPLVGKPLSQMGRYAGCQAFKFGILRPGLSRRGKELAIPECSVTVSCDWRIFQHSAVLVSSDDFGPGYDRRDEESKWFYEMLGGDDAPTVESLEARDDHGFLLCLSDGFRLEVTRCALPDAERWKIFQKYRGEMLAENEMWRFMPGDDDPHDVMTMEGWESEEEGSSSHQGIQSRFHVLTTDSTY